MFDDTENKELPDKEEITLTPDAGTKGSFTVRTQELGKDSSAEIKLTLVATYGDNDKQEVVIPYTIIIQNYKQTQTTKGGNS